MPRFVTVEGRLMEREVSTGGGSSGTWWRVEERDRNRNRNRSAVEARLRRGCEGDATIASEQGALSITDNASSQGLVMVFAIQLGQRIETESRRDANHVSSKGRGTCVEL